MPNFPGGTPSPVSYPTPKVSPKITPKTPEPTPTSGTTSGTTKVTAPLSRETHSLVSSGKKATPHTGTLMQRVEQETQDLSVMSKTRTPVSGTTHDCPVELGPLDDPSPVYVPDDQQELTSLTEMQEVSGIESDSVTSIDENSETFEVESFLEGDDEFASISRKHHPTLTERMAKTATSSLTYGSMIPVWGIFINLFEADMADQTRDNLSDIADLATQMEKPFISDLAKVLGDRKDYRAGQLRRIAAVSAVATAVTPFVPGIGSASGAVSGVMPIDKAVDVVGSKLAQYGIRKTGDQTVRVLNPDQHAEHYKSCRAMLEFALTPDTDGVNPKKQELRSLLGMDPRIKDYGRLIKDGSIGHFSEELARAKDIIAGKKPGPVNFVRLFIAAGDLHKIT